MTLAEVDDMVRGWERRRQVDILTVATAVWWLMMPHLSNEAKDSITINKIASTFPGWMPEEEEGE